ncbi:STAS domain-containing protein [Streptomyces sp. NRRL S-920]|uniref:STAS domain-containing protein n=1 Tax=Streptomyces sp. NRRL S-920 TaxID=1463921 RepID=UPI001F21F5B4|nr:STAS domain-containing protein [Streptomyces sp. NRRL S-920]
MNDPHEGHARADEATPRNTRLSICPLTDRAGVEVAGEICLPTHEAWEQALERVAQRQHGAYYFELSALTFIDMAGATALAMTAQGLPGGQRFVLECPPPALCRLLELFWPDLSVIEVAAS